MFWRSVLESYVWGLDLPDSRANVSVHACSCTVYSFATRRMFEPAEALAMLVVDVGQ